MTRAAVRLALSLAAFAPLALGARTAHAGNEAAAEALFLEAKKLVTKGKFAEACPKFAESNRLDRGAGTMIHLADCYEKNKQTASAWATYREAASAAQALGRADWEKLATARANALEPKLARLTVKVASPVKDIAVTRDDAEVSQASWGVALPVDVGAHTVTASAAGYKSFTTTINVAKDGEKKDVVVPALEAAPVAASAAPTPAPASGAVAAPVEAKPADADTGAGASSQKTVGFVVAGVGVVGVGVGVVTGLIAKGKIDDGKAVCPNDGGCASQSAVDSVDSGKSLGTVSTIAFAAGGVALVTGVVLVLTSPSKPSASAARLRVVPAAGPSTAGVSFSGAF